MIWIDYAIVAIILFSAIAGLVRGLMWEALSLLSWMAALGVGAQYHPSLRLHLQGIPDPGLRTAAAFTALFLATLVMGKLMVYLISTLLDRPPLDVPNRIGGFLFGASRGLLLTLVLIFLATAVGLAAQSWWRESRLLPVLEPWASALESLRPHYLRLAHFS